MGFQKLFSVIFLFIFVAPKAGQAAKILFFFSLGSYSHRVAVQPWVEKLAEVGHNVSVFSSAKPERPNLQVGEILPGFFLKTKMKKFGGDLTNSVIDLRLKDKFYNPSNSLGSIFEVYVNNQRDVVNSEEFREWAQCAKYDLIIYTPTGKEIALALAHRMKAKTIMFMPASCMWPHDMEILGWPLETSWYPDYTDGSRYWFIPEHFVYTYNRLSGYFRFKWSYLPQVDALVRKLFPGEEIPAVEKLIRNNISMVFLNEHHSTGYPISLPPFVVNVGGMHVKDSKGILPPDMEEFVVSKERFVFVSFGSLINVSELPLNMQKLLFRTVESFKNSTNFLWKWEGTVPEGLPSNVLALNWFPQQDVLAHPKCKGFITQGGQMSLQQAAYHGVPMIVIPVWGDQPFNSRSLEFHKVGLRLELADITEATFTYTIKEILNNPMYAKEIKQVSRRFRDRPLSPVDTAVYWTEYVLRHDTTHLKSPALNQSWWQKRVLDFYLVVLLVGAAAIISFRISLGKIILSLFMKLFYRVKAKLKTA